MQTRALTMPAARAPRSALALVTLGSLVGAALGLGYVQLALLGRADLRLLAFGGALLTVAGVVAAGRRWAPLLGTLLHGVLLGGNLEGLIHDLSHPEDTHLFAVVVVLTALGLVGATAGVLAAVQSYRRPAGERREPPWLRAALAAVAALCAGAILVAAIPREAGAAVSAETLAGLPAVTIADFNDGVVRVRAGELVALRLANTDGVGHSFDVDALGLHVTMPSRSDSLALFRAPEAPGEYRFYCAPHYHKASDSGMKGTLIVEP
ncbi:MAG TPA: cupredoxin domain-containing protein [Chloroflexaceae bacterium]|nr:cupredoxin domain-containing protein [Chloroflexaceae bacterium]